MVGLVAGVSEAIGKSHLLLVVRVFKLLHVIDVGSLDDNLTLPIISGGVMWALFRALDWALS